MLPNDNHSLLSVSPSELQYPLVLSVDVGSSSVRAAVYDRRGRAIRGAASNLARTFETTADGGFQMETESALEQVVNTIDKLFQHLPVEIKSIAGVGISCFWHSLLGVDDRGRPVTPLYSWADTRSANSAKELRKRLDEHDIHQRTGARIHPSYWPARLEWLRQTAPQTFRRVRRWLSFSDFVGARWCGRTSTSVSIASGTGVMNRFTCEWDESLLSALGISPDLFPAIASDNEPFARLLPEYASRWPLLRDAEWMQPIGDGAANNLGTGATTSDRIALMIGTSGAMRVMYEAAPPPELSSGLWCYRLDRKRQLVGGALSDGGGLYSWAVRSLNIDHDSKQLEKELAVLEPDSHGLIILPFWSGERSTGWHDNARGAILGFTLHTKPVEIVRATMEAIAFRFALIAVALPEMGIGARIIGSGGALRDSKTWTQILADVIGRPVMLSAVHEASSRGAALWALEAIDQDQGVIDAESTSNAVFNPNSARHDIYQSARAHQQDLYERVID